MATAAVLTISDRRSEGSAEDLSGPAAAKALLELGIEVVQQRIVPDEIREIRSAVELLLNQVSLVVTTGGTGIAERDVTPEALLPLFDKPLDGFGEIMRTASFGRTPLSIVSRGGAGIAGKTLIVMLPGSPKGVRECLELIAPALRHVLKILAGRPIDCDKEQSDST